MKMLPANPLFLTRPARVAAPLRWAEIDFEAGIQPIRQAVHAVFQSILRGMSMMEDMQLIPSTVHGYWEQHGHH